MNPITSPRRAQRVRHELKLRRLQVLRVATLSPQVRSVTLGGAELTGFISASFDDHLKLMLPAAGAAAGAEPVRRDYTPRHYDAATNELTLEFSLHGDGPAAAWAAQAQPGQSATIGGPRGSFIIPMDCDWHLLVGDETALPAIARRLQELPAGARVIAIVQVADAADRRPLASQAEVQLQWVASAPEALSALRALTLPSGDGFAWCAGEAATVAEQRRMLVDEKGHDRHAIRAAAYWKQGTAAHHQNLEDAAVPST